MSTEVVRTRVVVHGLVVDASYPLPGLPPAAVTSGRAADVDFRVRRGRPEVGTGPVLARVEDGARRFTVTDEGSGWLLDLHGTASIRLHHDRTVAEVVAGPQVAEALLPVLIAGPGLVAAVALRGAPMWHASGVLAGSGVVGFVGPTGAGKSTLARGLSSTERPLFSDDSLRITLGTGASPTAWRGTVVSRLRHPRGLDAASATSADGRLLLDATGQAPEQAPLAALVHPRLSPSFSQVQVSPLSGLDAVLLLSGCPALPGLWSDDLIRAHFEASGQLARAVPVLVADIPWPGTDAQLAREVLPAVLDHLPQAARHG